jgi:CRISPR-associated RAMP protein (TIGR02581 family)
MMLHHEVQNRLEITGTLTLKTAVHIGGSQNDGRGLSKILKDAFDRPIIPGSSLKGCLRSKVESMAHLVVPDRSVCHQVKEGKHTCLSAQKSGIRDIQKKLKEAKTDNELKDFLKEKLCPSCLLFGGASWKSKVSVDDLHPISDMIFPTENRDGVGIDRDTRLAAHGVKYQYEVIPAGSQFGLRIVAENLSESDPALLAVGILDLLRGNFAIGGKTSRGLGTARLENPELQFWDVNKREHKLALLLGELSPLKVEAHSWLSQQLSHV